MTATTRYFDEAAFQRDCLDAAAEASTTFFDEAYADAAAAPAAAAAAPAAATPAPPLLLAADSNGFIRAYLSAAVAATWLTEREAEPSSDPVFAWRAHDGAAYRLAMVGGGAGSNNAGGLVVSAGDDGFVRGWRLSEVTEAAAEAAARRQEEEEAQEHEEKEEGSAKRRQQRPASGRRRPPSAALARLGGDDGRAPLRPAFEVCLPPWLGGGGGGGGSGGTISAALASPLQRHHHPRPPAAQALCAGGRGLLFAGASDGGLFCIDGLADGGRAVLSTLGGHAAGVLALDACRETGAVASGGEDGLVHVWAPREQQQQQQQQRAPVATFAAGAGAGADAAAASSSTTYVSALTFDLGGTGGWLVAGTGAGDVELYSLPMRALARRAPAAAGAAAASAATMVPQALLLRPGEVLAAGTGPAVVAHRFSLEPPSELARCEVATDSVFALASASASPSSSSSGAGGVIAVAGAGATIELLSAQFTRLGLIQPPPSSNAAVVA